MEFLRSLTAAAKSELRTVVLAEAADERVVRAARILVDEKIASPVLTGDQSEISAVAEAHEISLNRIQIADPARVTNMDRYVHACQTGPRPLRAGIAERLLRKPLMYGALMVRLGDAHAMVAGASVPTAKVIEAGLMMIGPQKGIATPSSYFLMLVPAVKDTPSRSIIFADCAVNVDPTPEQLADIAISSGTSARSLLPDEPRIALLSFSTKGSARHNLIDRIKQALEIVREKTPDLHIDGEMQLDSALDPRTAAIKLKDVSPVAGKANVLVFPDLNSGNIAYKITQYLAGAQAIGPILQGFAHPVADLSRGATVEDIVNTTVVLLSTS